ncbi:DUF7289 family protein [Haloarchaeobius sp. DFWS5]|uniref:DUF7289 family protein n=1 Tax=Haloarchaeobius sp. DFWS5 TaxID=3446114 RepID=UPI003EC1455A
MKVFEERAVSDVLAFVLTFGIIITSVGLVYGIGFASLSDFQEGEQKTNAVRAFDALSTTFDDIQAGKGPGRSGSLDLSGGTLQVTNDTDIGVTVEDGGGTVLWSSTQFNNSSGSLQYSFEGTDVAYENGAVFRKDGDSPVMVSEPSFSCQRPASGPNRAVVSLVVLRSDENAIGGDTNVEIISRKTASTSTLQYIYPDRTGGGRGSVDVSVTVDDSAYETAWGRYFDDSDNDWTRSGNTATCTGADTAIVRVTVVSVEFQ